MPDGNNFPSASPSSADVPMRGERIDRRCIEDRVDETSFGVRERAGAGRQRLELVSAASSARSWQNRGMAGNVVNLNRFRKKKARDEKAKQAEINRIRHGRTQAEKERELAERARAARELEGKRLETPPESDD